MNRYAEPMSRLIDELKKLPGVGTKSAQRFAFHLLRSSDEDAAAQQDAQERAANQAAILIRLDLSRYFNRLATAK